MIPLDFLVRGVHSLTKVESEINLPEKGRNFKKRQDKNHLTTMTG